MFRTKELLPMLVILAVIGFAGASVVKAAPTIFLTRTGLGGLCDPPGNPNCANNITFEEPGYPTSPSLVTSITQLGVVFSSPGSTDGMGKVEVIPGNIFNPTFSNVLMSFSQDGTSYDLLITLPSGTTAVGFDLTNANNPGASFSIFVNGTPVPLATTYTSFTFFGVTDPVGIQTIRIVNPTGGTGGAPVIDNLTFGPAAAETPEPASMVLLGTGLVGIASAIRKQRKAVRARGDDRVSTL